MSEPPGYIPGAGRGAMGFSTRGDFGTTPQQPRGVPQRSPRAGRLMRFASRPLVGPSQLPRLGTCNLKPTATSSRTVCATMTPSMCVARQLKLNAPNSSQRSTLPQTASEVHTQMRKKLGQVENARADQSVSTQHKQAIKLLAAHLTCRFVPFTLLSACFHCATV